MFLMLVISSVSTVRIDVRLIEEGERHVLEQRRAVDHDQVVRLRAAR